MHNFSYQIKKAEESGEVISRFRFSSKVSIYINMFFIYLEDLTN